MKRIVVTAIVLLAGYSLQAYAAPGWTNYGKITTLEQNPGDGGSISNQVLLVANVTTNPSGCSVSTGFYFSLEGATQADTDRKKRLFTMLLSAQMASSSVRIFATGACNSVGYAELDGVVVAI